MSFFDDGLTLDQKIMVWNNNSVELKRLKTLEMCQRKELIDAAYADQKLGTNTLDLGAGYKLKATIKMTTSLDESSLGLILPEIPKEVQDAILKYKPSLVMKEYNKLSGKVLELVNEAIVTKPSSPSLELVIPKETV